MKITVSDNICIKGALTTCGSKMLYNFIPPYNAAVIDKITAAGGVAVREDDTPKMSEFSAGSLTVGDGQNNTVSLKPTFGSVSRFGIVYASVLDRASLMGKTVSDVAALYSMICGVDEKDATTVGDDARIVPYGLPLFARNDVINALKFTDAQCVPLHFPSLDYAVSAYNIISCAETASNLNKYDGIRYGYRAENCDNLWELYERTRAEGFGWEIKKRILFGTFVLTKDNTGNWYKKAKLAQQKIRAEFDEVFKEYDIITSPLTPEYKALTLAADLAGLPVITTPAPVGAPPSEKGASALQIIGPKFGEEMLFNAAYAYEKGGTTA